MIVTLDHSCIVALEKEDEEERASALRELAALCAERHITLAVYSYLPLENRPSKRPPRDLPARMAALGIGPIETLGPGPAGDPALNVWIQSVLFPTLPYRFPDYVAAVCAEHGIPLAAMEEANRDRLLPRIPWSPNDIPPPPPETLDPERKHELRVQWETLRRKWNNHKSDVLALGAHIAAGGDLFVTCDEHDYQHHLERLCERVPALRILTPTEALDTLRQMVTGTQAT